MDGRVNVPAGSRLIEEQTTIDQAALRQQFNSDLDRICKRLIQVFSIRFRQQMPDLSSPLYRWLDFRLRYVDPIPRMVVFSNKFPKAGLPATTRRALAKLCKKIQRGTDINPYQGRGLTLRNDFGGERKETRTDLLWADWGILHFHLSDEPIPRDQFYSKPADYLAFCLIRGNTVGFVDILRHPDKEGFSNPSLIETVASTWPDFMRQFEVNGHASGKSYTQSEIHALRSAGVAAIVNLNGKAYIGPGLGITSAATPYLVGKVAGDVHSYLDSLATSVADPMGPFRTAAISSLGAHANFSLDVFERGLAIYEECTRYAFLMPSLQPGTANSQWAVLQDLIFPVWSRHPYIDFIR